MIDPSKVSSLVMGQVARRKSEHEARNQAAKLTPQERRDKKKRKLLEDNNNELHVSGACGRRTAPVHNPRDEEVAALCLPFLRAFVPNSLALPPQAPAVVR